MKLRATLLVALLIGGAYMMFQSINDYNEQGFAKLFESMNPPFHSLIFTKPTTYSSDAQTWIVDDENEIEDLLAFLQNYHVRKLNAEEIIEDDDIDQFSISLEDKNGNTIDIFITEDIIIQNSLLYYKIVDGPLDVNWIVYFFTSNQT